jgi:hypothetical protein
MTAARLPIRAVLALSAAALQAAGGAAGPAGTGMAASVAASGGVEGTAERLAGARAGTILAGRLDGRSARIRHLHSARGCAALEADIRAAWQQPSAQPAAGLPPLETHAGPWRILSRLAADGLQVLQLQHLPAGRCEALLTHWPSRAEPSSAGGHADPAPGAGHAAGGVGQRPGLPSGWPAAIRVLRRVESGSQARRDLTLLARAPWSPAATLAALEPVWRPLGLIPRPVAAPTVAPAGGTAYTAEGARAQVALYLEAGDGFTHIVLMLQGDWS